MKLNLFETNELFVKRENLFDSFIYTVDNFYKHPKEIVNLLSNIPAEIHKRCDVPSYNYIHFYDNRHHISANELQPIITWIETLTSHKFKDYDETGANLFTNDQAWVDSPFNTWETHYWWPHLDFGYTALIYLDETDCGTNLYRCKNQNELQRMSKRNEHFEPWRPKQDWECIHRIEPKFNRLVIFEAGKLYHGLEFKPNLFKEKRLNQVMFFGK